MRNRSQRWAQKAKNRVAWTHPNDETSHSLHRTATSDEANEQRRRSGHYGNVRGEGLEKCTKNNFYLIRWNRISEAIRYIDSVIPLNLTTLAAFMHKWAFAVVFLNFSAKMATISYFGLYLSLKTPKCSLNTTDIKRINNKYYKSSNRPIAFLKS